MRRRNIQATTIMVMPDIAALPVHFLISVHCSKRSQKFIKDYVPFQIRSITEAGCLAPLSRQRRTCQIEQAPLVASQVLIFKFLTEFANFLPLDDKSNPYGSSYPKGTSTNRWTLADFDIG